MLGDFSHSTLPWDSYLLRNKISIEVVLIATAEIFHTAITVDSKEWYYEPIGRQGNQLTLYYHQGVFFPVSKTADAGRISNAAFGSSKSVEQVLCSDLTFLKW